MKKLSFGAGIVLAGPVLAHGGAHLHPHEGGSWLAVIGALSVLALAGRLVAKKVRS